jgi:hypothetical protein
MRLLNALRRCATYTRPRSIPEELRCERPPSGEGQVEKTEPAEDVEIELAVATVYAFGVLN